MFAIRILSLHLSSFHDYFCLLYFSCADSHYLYWSTDLSGERGKMNFTTSTSWYDTLATVPRSKLNNDNGSSLQCICKLSTFVYL